MNKKMSIRDLEVKSFVTSLDEDREGLDKVGGSAFCSRITACPVTACYETELVCTESLQQPCW